MSLEEMRDKYLEQENTCTVYTTCTSAASSDEASTQEPKSVDTKDKVQDSLLAKSLAENLKNTLVLDEITGDWFKCSGGIWQPITKVAGTKIINHALHEFLPKGFSMAKLNAIEGFLKLYLSLHQWETNKTLIPLKNGVLDSKTLILSDYSDCSMFNWQLPYTYDKNAEISVIKRWL